MTCLCVKLTGGWTSTQTPLMASRPLCWHPRSPALGLCQLQLLPTPTPAALVPQSMPEYPLPPSAPRILGTKFAAVLWARHSLTLFSLGFCLGTAVASLGTSSAQGQPTQERWGKGVPPSISGVTHSAFRPAGWKEFPGQFGLVT